MLCACLDLLFFFLNIIFIFYFILDLFQFTNMIYNNFSFSFGLQYKDTAPMTLYQHVSRHAYLNTFSLKFCKRVWIHAYFL